MYYLFTYDCEVCCDKDMFFKHIDIWKNDFDVVPVLTCNDELWFSLCNFNDTFILGYVGYCTDPEYLAPFVESMKDEVKI